MAPITSDAKLGNHLACLKRLFLLLTTWICNGKSFPRQCFIPGGRHICQPAHKTIAKKPYKLLFFNTKLEDVDRPLDILVVVPFRIQHEETMLLDKFLSFQLVQSEVPGSAISNS